MNVPLWTFSITKTMSTKIEKIQKIATYIILGKEAHRDYLCNLAILDLAPLSDRRDEIASNFGNKIYKHPIHKTIFQTTNSQTRFGNRVVVKQGQPDMIEALFHL